MCMIYVACTVGGQRTCTAMVPVIINFLMPAPAPVSEDLEIRDVSGRC